MPQPSYYFTLFKKLQILDHVPAGTIHGAEPPTGGFDLTDPDAAIGTSNKGALLGMTNNPAHSPLWAILNAKATGAMNVTVGTTVWPAMPPTPTPAWTEFQGPMTPAPRLVEVLGDWISAGKIVDIPRNALAERPAPIDAGLDAGVVPFVCSMPGDNGERPGTVPANYWATSLIYLVDPQTGNTVNPPALTSSAEYHLVAVVGNRGVATGGRYASPAADKLEAKAWVLVWNTGASPAVQLPALSNLDVTSTEGIYEIYFLGSGQYDVAGWRLPVQTVFDGLVRAISDSGMDLGGLPPEIWVHGQGAHLCAKVVIRQDGELWPTLGDTPITDRRFGQKNLAPFSIDLTVIDPDPNIVWRNFVMGDVLRATAEMHHLDNRVGWHRLFVQTNLPQDITRIFLAVPKKAFGRWFSENAIIGFKVVDPKAEGIWPPFPDAVVLAVLDPENRIEIPPLNDEFLALSLGIQYSPQRLKPGRLGEISAVQQTATLVLRKEKQSYKVEYRTVGGFTLNVEAVDWRKDLKMKRTK